ncbi:MAG: fumarylacetoacetate hydrolase family protein [Acidaminococcaceae bacterium]
MKCVRFKAKGKARIGIIEGTTVRAVSGSLDTYWRMTDEVFELEDVKLLAPCVPKQIICIGLNYRAHAEEINMAIPSEPVLFTKAAHTVIGPEEAILYPRQTKKLVYESELALVIKKKAKNVTPEEAHNYILGYTCANDVTARDLMTQEGQWLRSKSFDTFCPLGPWLETELDPTDLSIKLYLNGELKQDARTSQMLYNPYEIVSYISQTITLDAGDLILTGTPCGNGEMQVNDEVIVEIEGIGQLRNVVKSEKIV